MSNARRIADLLDSSGDVLGTNLDNVTTYSVGDGGLTTNDFTDADHTKLNAIEASATADQTGAEIKTAYEAEANAYTDTKDTKLSGIATSANNYSHPSGAGNSHIPTGGSVDQLLTNTASGTGTWQDAPVSLPSQTGNANKQLTTDGSTASWADTSITLDSPSITGTLSIDDGSTVTHTIGNWSEELTYVITPTNCTVGSITTSGVFVVTHTSGTPSYTIKATTDSLGLADSSTVTKNIVMNLSAPTISSPADALINTNVVYTITSTDSNDNKLILDLGSSNFTFGSVSHGSGSKVGNTVEVTGFTTNNPAITLQFTAEATYSVTAKSVNIAGTYGDSASSSADSITIANSYSVDYLVVAGGGGGSGGGQGYAGGGGAGGLRTSYSTDTSGGGCSSESSTFLPVTSTVYTITVGAGGAGSSGNTTVATNGQNSSISGSGLTTITSTGGGGGASVNWSAGGLTAGSGGSGGGEGYNGTHGSGTSCQGYDGGTSPSGWVGCGGGGAGEVGDTDTIGYGGDGVISTIITTSHSSTYSVGEVVSSDVYFAGGGGGSADGHTPATRPGGDGGGGDGSGGYGGNFTTGTVGSVNTGGGGGGDGLLGGGGTKAGGSGVVILRMLTSDYSGTTSGSPTVLTSGSDTILMYTGSGSYTG